MATGATVRPGLARVLVTYLLGTLLVACTADPAPSSDPAGPSTDGGLTLTTAAGGTVDGAAISPADDSTPTTDDAVLRYGTWVTDTYTATFTGEQSGPVAHVPLPADLKLGTYDGHQVTNNDLVIMAWVPGPDIWIPLPTTFEATTGTVAATLPYDIDFRVLQPSVWVDNVVSAVGTAATTVGGWAISAIDGYVHAIAEDISAKLDELLAGREQEHMDCANPKQDWDLVLASEQDKILGCLVSANVPVIKFENRSTLPLDVEPAPGLHFKPRLNAGQFGNLQDMIMTLTDYFGGRMFLPPNGVAEASWDDRGPANGGFINLSALNWAVTGILATLQTFGRAPELKGATRTQVGNKIADAVIAGGPVTPKNLVEYVKEASTATGLTGANLERLVAAFKAASCAVKAVSSGDLPRTFTSWDDAAKTVRTGVKCATEALGALAENSIQDGVKGALTQALGGPFAAVGDAFDIVNDAKSFAASFPQSISLYGRFNGGPKYGLAPKEVAPPAATAPPTENPLHVILTDADAAAGTVTYDGLQWFEGPDAVQECLDQGASPEGAAYCEYAYRNDNPRLLPATLSPDATFQILTNKSRLKLVSAQAFFSALRPWTANKGETALGTTKGAYWLLHFASATTIDSVTEVYVP